MKTRINARQVMQDLIKLDKTNDLIINYQETQNGFILQVDVDNTPKPSEGICVDEEEENA